MCKLKIELTSHNYSTVRAEWRWEVIQWSFISSTVNYNLFVVKKMFWWLQHPIHVAARGDFLTLQILLWAGIAQEFPQREKATKNVLYLLIKGSSVMGVWLLFWLSFLVLKDSWGLFYDVLAACILLKFYDVLAFWNLTHLSSGLRKVSPFDCCVSFT